LSPDKQLIESALQVDSRMAAAELASREQMLRLEYRLAELGDSLKRE
jgi:hypothetical protein